jgi:hypothetical protein
MKNRHTAIAIVTISCATWLYFHDSAPTIISVRIGDTFEQVTQASSFPVIASSDRPTDNQIGFGVTLVKKPAVIIRFDDSRYGFSLPPTAFAAIGYMHNKVDTIATSPMLSKLSYDQAIALVANLQSQFMTAGWQLDDGTTWFDLTSEGREALHSSLRFGNQGHRKEVSLRAPEKYSMTFLLRCVAGCDSHIGLDRYLIDIGIAQDFEFAIQTRKRLREEAMTP